MDLLSSMRAFVAVSERGSFVKAAQQLRMSRPMVSKHIANLETHLGVQLLNRTTRSISLTDQGQIQLEQFTRLLHQLDESMDTARGQRNHAKGVLRVNAPISFGSTRLTPLILNFQKQHPDLKVELTLSDRLVHLIDEGYDLAVRIGTLGQSDVRCVKISECEMILCASPGYIEKHGDLSSVEDLGTRNCLVYEYFSTKGSWTFQHAGGLTKVAVSGNFSSNSGEALAAAACESSGIAFLPEFLVTRLLEEGRLKRLFVSAKPPALPIQIVFPNSKFLPLKSRLFVDYLKQRPV
ncbi:LysR family transcriptional regulator [Phaeobacter sp. 11ANDIMAR09]|uniref:LysR family transcriptional regulator n=1 Tax=Phaeobacter sp. 11ANDIMAR09 TaxID=1225647 RepID=UPI0006D6CA9F|nr:LysR family transcriptional regulator [Phaeobacter sp. 11ANDIMAR09]KPD11091.1 hypothetical protein AN476_17785 [Phaeobacter sp. 11ANDIMAR09]